MWDNLCILLVAHNVKCRVVDGYTCKVPKYIVSCDCRCSEHGFGGAHLWSMHAIFWIWLAQRSPRILEEVRKPSNNGI